MSHDAPTPGDVAENARFGVSEHSMESIDIAPSTFELSLPVGWISWDAAKVLRRLQLCGHTAYLVGGCVRDLLLGRYPKDFDVATSARPREVKRAFTNCRLIGRRFRLAHILFNENTIEVATFRRDPSLSDGQEEGEFEAPDIVDRVDETDVAELSKNSGTSRPVAGMLRDEFEGAVFDDSEVQPDFEAEEAVFDDSEVPPDFEAEEAVFDDSEVPPDFDDEEEPQDLLIRSDNVFGTPREDALRRDFTINGLFYDLSAETVIDWSGGVKDIEARVIRTIGDPVIRFREDPVRMLRAIKFASFLRFEIEPATWAALCLVGPDISRSAAPRVLEEILRMMRGGASRACFDLLEKANLLQVILPEVAQHYGDRRTPETEALESPGELETTPAETSEVVPGESTGGVDDNPQQDPAEKLPVPFMPGLPALLDALDQVEQGQAPISNPILIVLLCLTPVFRGLEEEDQPFSPEQAFRGAGDVLETMGARLRIARRDRERARLVLLGFSKLLTQSSRRGYSPALVRKSYFSDAITLYALLTMARGGSTEELKKITRRAALNPETKLVLQAASKGSGASTNKTSSEPERQEDPTKRRRPRRRGRSRRNATHRNTDGGEAQRPAPRLEGDKTEAPG